MYNVKLWRLSQFGENAVIGESGGRMLTLIIITQNKLSDCFKVININLIMFQIRFGEISHSRGQNPNKGLLLEQNSDS